MFLSVLLSLSLALAAAPPIDDGDAADRALAAWSGGDWAGAAGAYAEVVQAQPEDLLAWYRLGYALHALGRIEEALVAHERAAAGSAGFAQTAAYNAACAHALLGDVGASLAALDRALELGFTDSALLASDSDLRAVRADARFAELWTRLAADTPAPPAEELARLRRDFDVWLGDWDVQVRHADGQGGWSDGGKLRVRVDPVLDGLALVESAEGQMGANQTSLTLGYSLRAVDPDSGRWQLLLNWPSSGSASFGQLSGSWRHHRGEFFSAASTDAQGQQRQTRFTFSDAVPGFMRWDGASTADGGKTWNTDLIFEKTARPAGSPRLWDGASRDRSAEVAPAARQLDFALGSWAGERVPNQWIETPGEPTVFPRVRREFRSILDGVMVEERVFVDGVEELYAVHGYDTGASAWRSFQLTRDDTKLREARTSFAATDAATIHFGWASPKRRERQRELSLEGGALKVRARRPDAPRPFWTETLRLIGD